MRLLLVSDVHYRLRQLDWLAHAAADPDLAIDAVVIAGDLLDIRSAVPLEVQAIAISAQLTSLGERTPVFVCSGNHDLDARDAAGEKSARWLSRVRSAGVHVDGDCVDLGELRFTVCPWWDGPHGQARLVALLENSKPPPGRRWAWVYHSPPTGSPLSFDGRREFGDDALAGWIPRFSPDVILAGHIHQAPFVDGGGWRNASARPGSSTPASSPDRCPRT